MRRLASLIVFFGFAAACADDEFEVQLQEAELTIIYSGASNRDSVSNSVRDEQLDIPPFANVRTIEQTTALQSTASLT
eukprot:3098500-Pleurochrysis_carterae.AAC.1